MKERFWKNKATVVIGAANILIWILLELRGSTLDADYMYKWGAMSAYGVLVDHEVWRFFTSTFLHFGPEHLINNMLLLAVAGSYLEPAVGSLGFTVIYVVSGVLGSAASCMYMLYTASWTVSAGASGAIFGIVGGLLFMIIRGRGSFSGIRLKGMMLAVILMLYAGLSSKGVDNTAHVGGFVSGFIATAVVYIIHRTRLGDVHAPEAPGAEDGVFRGDSQTEDTYLED